MTTVEKILGLKRAGRPFTIHLSDGRRFLIDHQDFVSTHPGGKGTNVIIYGHGEDEEHFVPVFAITSVSENATS
jgi:hypothetical protein